MEKYVHPTKLWDIEIDGKTEKCRIVRIVSAAEKEYWKLLPKHTDGKNYFWYDPVAKEKCDVGDLLII